ncbi:MAG: hypothetical protein AAFV07_04140 [Bacteroidota bacterium]
MFLNVQTIRPKAAPQRRNRPLAEAQAEAAPRKRRGKGKVSLPKTRIKSWVLYPVLLVGLGILLSSVYTYQQQMPLRDIKVKVEAPAGYTAMNGEEIKAAMGIDADFQLIGTPMEEIPLQAIEDQVVAHPKVADAEIHKSMQGILHLDITFRQPIARLVNNSGEFLFMDANGVKFPADGPDRAYVPLIRGDFEETVADTFDCSTIPSVLPVLNYVRQDSFWNAQIAEIVIAQSGELTLHQTIGDMPIEFGYPVRVGEKFENLMDFYRQVLPEVGWNAYRRISVKYRGQVVGKKR